MTEFAGNYQGPLYAPHPDLIEKRKKLEDEELNNTDTDKQNESKT